MVGLRRFMESGLRWRDARGVSAAWRAQLPMVVDVTLRMMAIVLQTYGEGARIMLQKSARVARGVRGAYRGVFSGCDHAPIACLPLGGFFVRTKILIKVLIGRRRKLGTGEVRRATQVGVNGRCAPKGKSIASLAAAIIRKVCIRLRERCQLRHKACVECHPLTSYNPAGQKAVKRAARCSGGAGGQGAGA